MKYFGIGLITGILMAGIWFWNNPRIVPNTHLETITDTIYITGIQTIDTVKKVSSDTVSVPNQGNLLPCFAPVDTVVMGKNGSMVSIKSKDFNKYPLTVVIDVPELVVTKVRVDTVKVFEMKMVEVEREVEWYGTPLAHAVYGVLILTLFVIGD